MKVLFFSLQWYLFSSLETIPTAPLQDSEILTGRGNHFPPSLLKIPSAADTDVILTELLKALFEDGLLTGGPQWLIHTFTSSPHPRWAPSAPPQLGVTLLQSTHAFSPDISSLHIKNKCLFFQGLAILLSSAVAPLCTRPRCASTVPRFIPKPGVGEEAEALVSSQEGLCPMLATSDP